MAKNAVWNLAICCGTIWRRREKRNIGAQLQSLTCIIAQKIFWKIYFLVWLLVRTNLFIPSPFWTTYTNFDSCCPCYVARCGKKNLYRCTSTFSPLNYCSEIFFKSLSYTYEVVRQTFPPISGLFEIFNRNFTKIVAPPNNKNKYYLVYLKGQSMVKNSVNTEQYQNWPINRDTTPVQRTACRPRSVTEKQKKINKKNIQTPCFRTYSRRT